MQWLRRWRSWSLRMAVEDEVLTLLRHMIVKIEG